jgi:hypothetical protein
MMKKLMRVFGAVVLLWVAAAPAQTTTNITLAWSYGTLKEPPDVIEVYASPDLAAPLSSWTMTKSVTGYYVKGPLPANSHLTLWLKGTNNAWSGVFYDVETAAYHTNAVTAATSAVIAVPTAQTMFYAVRANNKLTGASVFSPAVGVYSADTRGALWIEGR